MTFSQNIPQSSDDPSASQSQFLVNNQTLYAAFNRNHVELDDGTAANRGKHKWATFPEQSSDPTTIANEVAVYSKETASVATLFLRKESDGTVVQLSGQDPTVAASGSTFLPGGIVIKWGSGTADGTTTAFASAFPNNCWTVQATCNSNSLFEGVNTYTLTTTNFIAKSNNNQGFTYIAIGN